MTSLSNERRRQLHGLDTHEGLLADAGILSYTASRNGTLAYLSKFPAVPPLELDRSGQPVANLLAEPRGVWSWDVGRERPWLFLASEDRGLFRYDWEAGGTPQPLYPNGLLPVAGPGDTLVAFINWRGDSPECSVGVLNVNSERVDTIISGPKCYYPTDWSPDGEELLLSDQLTWLLDGTLPPAIWAFSFADDSLRLMVREPQATAWRGTYSPDGEWIAFGSDRTGRFEVYVQPRDGSSRAGEPISQNGAVWPRWGNGGRELYFLDPHGDVLAAAISDDDPGPPTRLFSLRGWTRFGYSDGVGTLFDVAPNGDRFFVSRSSLDPMYLVVIQNGTN